LRQKSQLDENVFQTSLAPFNEDEDSIAEKTDDGSCTDSGLEVKYEKSIDVDVQSVQSAPTADNIREAVFDTAICMNVSKILYILIMIVCLHLCLLLLI